MRLVIRSRAQAEAFDATYWYESKQQGLGERFRLALEAVYDQILTLPRLGAIRYKNVRSFPLQRFPYRVFWVVKEKQIEVLAICHYRTDPGEWPAEPESLDS